MNTVIGIRAYLGGQGSHAASCGMAANIDYVTLLDS